MARAVSALSPTVRRMRPQRVRRSRNRTATVVTRPSTNSAFTRRAERTGAEPDHHPSDTAGKCGAVGPTSGLPRKKARPTPNSISAIPTAMSFTGGQDAQPGRVGQVGDTVGRHRPHHQRPLEAEVYAPALFGQALAEADEQEWRADPDRATDHPQRDAAGRAHSVTARAGRRRHLRP